MTVPAKRTGRRPGGADTRGEILNAARAEFAQRGYEKTTIRAIARAADVDAALVHHYFGAKEQVFLAAMQFPVDPALLAERIAGDRAGMGERLARFAVGLWETPEVRDRLVALLRSAATNDELAATMRGFVGPALVARLAPVVGGPDAELRVELALAQIVGVAMARYVIAVEPIASADGEALVALLAPVLQAHLAGTEAAAASAPGSADQVQA